MWPMTALKQQESNDELLGFFSLELRYTLYQVGIDKSRPVRTSSQFSVLCITVWIQIRIIGPERA
jgi:hypothetical protein